MLLKWSHQSWRGYVVVLQPVEDPEGMTKIIIEALDKTGQRGIIGRGWGGIGDCEYHFFPRFQTFVAFWRTPLMYVQTT